jgi:hypothetical protein
MPFPLPGESNARSAIAEALVCALDADKPFHGIDFERDNISGAQRFHASRPGKPLAA